MSTRRFISVLLIALAAGACSDEVTGPSPGLAKGDGGVLPADPGYLCLAREETAVAVHGARFAPLAVGLPDSTRASLPALSLVQRAELDGDPVLSTEAVTVPYGAEPGEPNADLLSWESRSQMTFRVRPELDLAAPGGSARGAVPAGVYDLQVRNPAGGMAVAERAVAVVEAPSLAATTPGVACVAQGERSITLGGADFVVVDGAEPAIAVGDDAVLAPAALSDCVDVPHAHVPGRVCRTAEVTLPAAGLPDGLLPVQVRNPAPADCSSADPVALRVVPPPSLAAVDPPIACVAEGPREVVLIGADLLKIDGVLPAVVLTDAAGDDTALEVLGADGCEALETQGHRVERCARLTVVVPQRDPEAPFRPTLTVTNPDPAGCAGATSTGLMLVPPPTIDVVEPPLACTAQGARDAVVRGAGFLRVDGVLATATLDGAEVAVTDLRECESLEVQDLPVERCAVADVVLPDGVPAIEPGGWAQPSLEFTNPAPAGCGVEDGGSLTLVPPPVADVLDPPIVCVAQGARTVTLSGSGLISADGTLPAALAGDVALGVEALAACAEVPAEGAAVQTCREATLTVGEDVPAGLPRVVVTNPDPAGCESTEALDLRVVPPPAITAVEPPIACPAEGPRAVVLVGRDFLGIDDALPAVTMTDAAGAEVALAVLGLAGDCEPVPTPGRDVQRCTGLAVEIPAAALEAPYRPTITVTNPDPAGCGAATSEGLMLVPAPALAAVAPALTCTAQGERAVTLSGEGFLRIGDLLPAVQVGDAAAAVDGLEGCEALPVAGLEAERCTVARVRVPEDAPPIEADAPWAQATVTLTNPAPAGCGTALAEGLTAAPPPAPAAVAPALTCLEQGGRTLTVSGRQLLRVGGALPAATLGDAVVEVTALDGCQPLPAGLGETCAEATVNVAEGAVPPGLAELLLVNPAPADCRAEEALPVQVLAAPTIAAFEPSVVCPGEEARAVTIRGAGFVRVGDALPSVTATDAAGAPRALTVLGVEDCAAVAVAGLAVERCAALRVELPVEALAEARRPTITVTNPDPAGCAAADDTGLLLVPPPSIDAGEPAVACAGERTEVVVTGAGFITLDGVPPAVTFNGVAAQGVVADGCAPLAVAGAEVRTCTRLRVPVDAAQLQGDVRLEVVQPGDVGCGAVAEQSVVVVEPPRIDAVEPSLVCTEDGARPVALRGDGFLRFGGALPSVRLGDLEVLATAVEDCRPMEVNGLAWEACRGLTVTLPQGQPPAGTPVVQVVGPEPAACVGGAEGLLTIPPPLTIAAVAPERVCVEAGDRVLRVTGTGFLEIDGALPTVTVAGADFAADALAGCEAIAAPGHAGRACTTLTVTVPQSSVPAGLTAVAVTNPAPSSCGERAEEALYVIPLPEIAAVAPEEVCEDHRHRFTITGRNFIPESEVFLGAAAAESVEYVDEGTLIAVFDAVLEPGLYDLSVRNGDGCDDTSLEAVRVHPTPIVFFVDPPVVYNGINLQVTVYTSGLDAPPAVVQLLGPDGEVVDLAFVPTPGRPNKNLATIPSGLPPGVWGVRVTSRINCVGEVPGAVTLTDDLRVGVTDIDPGFASPTRATAVTLLAAPVAGQVGFVSTPRAYLNPSDGAPGVLATALRAVVFLDAARLTAVVPPDLSPGAYDLIVVNPDATVGLLARALVVTEGEPPVVTAVEPASLDNNAPQRARVVGEDFDTEGGVQLALTCRDPNSGALRTVPAVVDAGTLTATSVVGVFPADQFPAGSVCLVELTNADGAVFRFSAVSLKTPAQNLNPWRAAEPMVEARRAPALVAGRPTATSRFLYAIGGDDGAPASAKASVEAASVDVFGDLGAWSVQRHPLPAARTLAGVARVGRFLYLAGGHDGDAATDTVFRAEILDPLTGPEIIDVDLAIDREAADGVAPGLWHYRVAAVFGPDHPTNPGGESLPGEALVAQFPDIAGLRVRLDWEAVTGAVGYRVYRTPAAGDPIDQVVLLVQLEGGGSTTYVDLGADTIAPDQPLPPGSLGIWHLAGALGTPREGAAVIAAPVPAGNGEPAHALYAFGGRDDAGRVLDTYEVVRIEAHAEGHPVLLPPVPGPQRLAVARADLAAFAVTNVDTAAVPPGQVWLFVGPGRGAGGFSREVEAGPVAVGGALGALIQTDRVNVDAAGYGYGAANGFLYIFGGRGGAPNDAGISGELCLDANTAGCAAAPAEPPDIRNWNNLGVRLTVPRAFPGSAQESAFFFLAGGNDGSGATRSVERTVQ